MNSASGIDLTRADIKLGKYRVATQDALSDRSIHLRVQDYRRHLGAHMVALDQSGIRRKLPAAEYFVSRKMDGEFTVAVVDGDWVYSVNPGGTVRCGLPFLDELKAAMDRAGVRRIEFAGELYVHRTDRRPRVHDVVRVARQPESVSELESLRFAAFDLLTIDGCPPPTYADAVRSIENLLADGVLAHPVETVAHVEGPDGVATLFEKWVVAEGAEGIVCRSDAAGIYKVKQRFTVDVVVIGFMESAEEERAGMLHDLLVAVLRDDRTFHILGHVGGGFSDEERRSFLADLKEMTAPSEYAEVDEQVAYTMVRPEWAIEISCLDLLTENSRGASIKNMALHYGPDGYRVAQRLPLCSPISPQFVRIRHDKKVTPDDLSIRQLAAIRDIPLIERSALEQTLPQSSIVRRQVYTKTIKGQTLVRKLLLWQTNKDEYDESYPGYVAYVTDYSPGRKTPLQSEVRISDSREQIDALFEELESQYVVKGWSQIEG